MLKKQYKLNTQTLTYEVISAPFRIRFYLISQKILIGLILASLVNFVFSLFMYTPKVQEISLREQELIMKYEILQDKADALLVKLTQLKHRDNNVYRSLFAADTLDMPAVYTPYAESKYAHLQGDDYTDLMQNTWKSIDHITRMTYLQSKSLDQLQTLSQDKEKMATAIPAIWPINRKSLRGSIGLYGYRNHPILGRYIKHDGIDLGANKGTPVYAPGDGIVIKDKDRGYGYGKQILIDHGFGYVTRYAHLNAIGVEIGQEVKRGEVIGEVGNTGRSTGPHLHYEVIYQGKTVDPLNYFRRDMSAEEFEEIIASAQPTTYEAD